MHPHEWPWKPQPDYTRLLRTLRRQGEPHHVPFLELSADPEMISAVLGEPAVSYAVGKAADREAMEKEADQKIRFWHLLGYDAFWHRPVLEMPDLLRLESDDIASMPRDKRRWVDEKAGIITNWEDFERYPWPRAADADLHPIEYAVHHLPEGMGLIAEAMGVLEPAMWLMGYETFALAIYDQPDLVQAVFDRLADIYVSLARALAQMDGVIALWMGDDMGFKTGTMIAPKHLRRFVFPMHQQVAHIAHEQGMPFLLHSCGNLEAVMEELIEEVGIDAKHSYEDVIIPVEDFAARYGDRIGIIGGVDMNLLARGTEEQVRAGTRRILERCAPSGGYVLGSGNTVANYVPVQNFLAMLDEGWRYNTSG